MCLCLSVQRHPLHPSLTVRLPLQPQHQVDDCKWRSLGICRSVQLVMHFMGDNMCCACSSSSEADMLRRLRFGSDHKADLEDLSPSTAVFLWNYEKQRLHGIFAGTLHLVKDTTKDAAYLYEVSASEVSWPSYER